MSYAFIVALSLVLGLLAAIASIRPILRHGRRRPAEAIVVGVVPTGLVLYEAGVLGKGATTQILVLIVAFGVSAFAVLSSRERWRSRLYPSLFLPSLLVEVLFVTNALGNSTDGWYSLLLRAAPVFYWAALALLLSTSTIDLRLILASAVLALSSVAMLTPLTGNPTRPCDQFKCGVFGYIYTGPFISENYLAKIASIVLILAITIKAGKLSMLGAALGAVLVLAATSRTAGLSLIVAVIACLVAPRLVKSLRRGVVLVSILANAGVSWYIVETASATDFSNRGYIWQLTKQAIGDNFGLGLGIDRWAQLQDVGALPQNFPHNQLLLLLFAGGIVACVLYVGILLSFVGPLTATSEAVGPGTGLLTYIGVSGLTEVMWNASTIDGHSFAMTILLCVVSVALRAHPYPDEASHDRERRRELHAV